MRSLHHGFGLLETFSRQLAAQLTDPKDEAVLELAVAAGGVPIITYNKDHYRGAERFGVRILTAFDFLSEIGAVEPRGTL
jgi:predicted nucleic acid-binding protein